MYFLRITAYAEELLAALDELPGWPEQVKLMQKNWIGRSEGVRGRLSYRLETATGCCGSFTTRADTLMGATFMAVAAEHPIAAARRDDNPSSPAFVDECRKGAVMEADLAQIEKKGMPTGPLRVPPADEREDPGMGGRTTCSWDTAKARSWACRRTTSATIAFALKYKLPIKPVIRHRLGDTVPAPWKPEYAEYGVCINSGPTTGSATRARSSASPRISRRKAWARSRCSGGCATGASRASATGARRSRSCTAPPAATCRCRTPSCRSCCPRTWYPTAPATRSRSGRVLPDAVPAVRQAGEARDRHDGHLRRLVVVLRALRLPRPDDARWSTSARCTGCRSTSTSAASSTPSCTCSTRASSSA